MNLANHFIEFLVRRSTKEHSILVRTIATLAGVTLFVAGIPALVFLSGKFLDKSSLLHHQVSQTASIVCFILRASLDAVCCVLAACPRKRNTCTDCSDQTFSAKRTLPLCP